LRSKIITLNLSNKVQLYNWKQKWMNLEISSENIPFSEKSLCIILHIAKNFIYYLGVLNSNLPYFLYLLQQLVATNFHFLYSSLFCVVQLKNCPSNFLSLSLETNSLEIPRAASSPGVDSLQPLTWMAVITFPSGSVIVVVLLCPSFHSNFFSFHQGKLLKSKRPEQKNAIS